MFQLTKEEAKSLTSQFARSKEGRGGRRTLPYAFTEQGVAMLSTVLNSDREEAIANIKDAIGLHVEDRLAAGEEMPNRYP
jgi:hypothetical protein